MNPDRFKNRVRGDPASPADREDDIQKLGGHLGRRELIGNRPFWFLRGVAEFIVIIDVVDLEDQAVDIVIQRRPFLGVFANIVNHFIDAMEDPPFLIGAEAQGIEVIERIRMDVEIELPRVYEIIPEGFEVARGRDRGIKVTNRACRGITAIREDRLARELALNVHVVERLLRHIDFAPDFERALFFHVHRNRMDRDDVRGHIFAGHAIAAGDGILELAILVDERHPKPVDFDFAHVSDFVDVKDVSDLPVKVPHLVFVIDVTQGKHEPFVGDFLKFGLNVATDSLGRGVLALEARELFFQEFELAHEPIEIRVAHRRLIENVIFVVVLLEELR